MTLIMALVLAATLLRLPAYAQPTAGESVMTDDITGTTDPAPEGEGTPHEGSSVTDGAIGENGNLGDTDGDGKVESKVTTAVERDPIDAIENMTRRNGGWITAAVCIAVVVALILIIVALIPKKRR